MRGLGGTWWDLVGLGGTYGGTWLWDLGGLVGLGGPSWGDLVGLMVGLGVGLVAYLGWALWSLPWDPADAGRASGAAP